MNTMTIVENLSKKYDQSSDDFIRLGSILTLKEKKRLYHVERLEYLSRYGASTVQELREKVKEGTVPEHPSWEDLIEIKNIESAIKEIEDDIRALQET